MDNKRLTVWLDGYNEIEWKEIGIEFPLYIQCYEEALAAILHTIEYNSKDEEKKQRDLESFQKKMYFAGIEDKNTEALEKSNIIAFVGDRGVGKSTALSEFCRILYHYPDTYINWSSKITYKTSKQYKFHILEPIDAAVLEKKEDLMEVILASMYQAFQNKMDAVKRPVGESTEIREIVKGFDDVYRDYINVGKYDEQQLMCESVLAKLKYISGSSKTKTALEGLIKKFLRFLDDGHDRDSYLIIVIDDLDLSPENGYEMMDQLHKYLSIPKVIILVAIKYEQMKMICNQHFVDCITPRYGGIHKNVYERNYEKAKRLSSDYLLKVLPTSNRIYMPEGSLLDKKGLVIVSDNTTGKEKRYTVKEFILEKIANKMNIYYDATGTKRHFCLPDTIRELAFYNQFLDSLYSMEEIECERNVANAKQMILYDQNHERFNNDIEYKMAMRILDEEQWDLYREIMKTSVERRTLYTVAFLESWMEEKEKEQKYKGYKRRRARLKQGVDGRSYCYADLLKTLYILGRKDYIDKALVHCILASFTAEMVREYYSYKHNKDIDAKNQAAEYLQKFLGNTFGGKWFEKSMPKLLRKAEAAETKSTARIKIGYIPNINISKNKSKMKITMATNFQTDEMNAVWIGDTLLTLCPCIERFVFLFSNFRDENGKSTKPKWNFKITSNNTSENYSMEVHMYSIAEKADFDVFGFIGKEIYEVDENGEKVDDISNVGKQIKEDFIDGFQDLLDKLNINLDTKNRLKKEFQENLYKCSIWKDEAKENDNAVFPFYNLDMSYNIMKRIRKNLENTEQLKDCGVYDLYCTVYEYIADELKREDEKYDDKYRKGTDKDNNPNLLKNFLASPYIQGFKIQDNVCDDKVKQAMGTFLDEMLRSIGEIAFIVNIREHDIT